MGSAGTGSAGAGSAGTGNCGVGSGVMGNGGMESSGVGSGVMGNGGMESTGVESASTGRSKPVEPPSVPLTDGVVTLRLRRESDLDAIMAASHDAESLRWLTDPPMNAETRRTSLARVAEAWESGTAAPLMIASAETDEPAGIVNLQFRNDEVAAIAYSVFPTHHGQGIAPRAVELLSTWALNELNLTQLLLEADEANAASLRVAEKCNFTRITTRTEPTGEVMAVFARTAS